MTDLLIATEVQQTEGADVGFYKVKKSADSGDGIALGETFIGVNRKAKHEAGSLSVWNAGGKIIIGRHIRQLGIVPSDGSPTIEASTCQFVGTVRVIMSRGTNQ